MKLIIIFFLILSFNSFADSDGVCEAVGIDSEKFTTYSWEMSQMCIDPYSIICEKDNAKENFKARSTRYIKRASDQAGQIVYERNKSVLNSFGIDHVDDKNYDDIFKFHQNECFDDNLFQCHLGQLEFDPNVPSWFKDDLEEQFLGEFYKAINQELDPMIDRLSEAFNIVKSSLIQIVEEELKGRVSNKKLKDIIHKLAVTKGVFSSSNKSMQQNFPFLSEMDRENIRMSYESFCFRGINSSINAMFYKDKIKGREFDITMFCPVDYLGGVGEAKSLLSVFNSMALIISHELGHQVNETLKHSNVFRNFNSCMDKHFSKEKLAGPSKGYDSEGQADYWAKRVIGEHLNLLKDSPYEDKLEFIKETSIILCETEDDSVHHPGRLRINRALKMTRAFMQAFDCSQRVEVKDDGKSIDCSLHGVDFAKIY
jgi:hypothetical protein